MSAESPITLDKALRKFYAFVPSCEVRIEEVFRAKIERYYDIVAAFWKKAGLGYDPELPPINEEVWKIISGNGMLFYLPKTDSPYELLNELFPRLGIKKQVERLGIVDADQTQNTGWFDTETGTYQPHRWIANGELAREDEVLEILKKKDRSPATLAHHLSAALFWRASFGNRHSGIVIPDQTLLMGSKANTGESIIGEIASGRLRIDISNKNSVPGEVNIRSVRSYL